MENNDMFIFPEEIVLSDPIKRRIVDERNNRYTAIELESLSKRNLISILEEARKKGTLEPLTTLTYFLFPQYCGKENIEKLLLPYKRSIERLREELSQNLIFDVQTTKDNVWGDAILANGKLIMKEKDNLISYKYRIKRKSRKNLIIFKRLHFYTNDLKEAVDIIHEPNFIESVIRVYSKKPYSIKKTILPYFAYELIGLKD